MKKIIYVFVVFALLSVSFFNYSVAGEKEKTAKNNGVFINPGYYLVKLGMKKKDVESNLLKNGFVKLRGNSSGDVYMKENAKIKGYPHLSMIIYRFQFNANSNTSSYWSAWGNFHKREGNNFWIDMRGFDVSGIAYMPSYHLPAVPSYECNLPYRFHNNPCNFGFFPDAPLITFKVEMTINEEYRDVFSNYFIKKLSDTYGQQNAIGYAKAGASGYEQVDAAWIDDKTFLAARSHNAGRSFDLYFTISSEEPLRKRLAELEGDGIRLIQQCKQAKQKSFNQIKID